MEPLNRPEILLDGQKFQLDPSRPLKAYICGPTVYNDSHLGHARSYMSFDIFRRILKTYFGQEMFVVMNVTDIDDKIINRAHEERVPFTEIATRYEASFFEDMDTLHLARPDVVTHVTEYIDEIINYIQTILDNGFAYRANGSVYFDAVKFMTKFPDSYNPFGLTLGDGDHDSGDDVIISEKRDRRDFALWKARKADHEAGWASPFSDKMGRPAWNIECSVMATSTLGPHMDLHFGGVDLRFPHHTNEILQVLAHQDTSDHWVERFVHFGHLQIRGLKMSKSLKNFITIKEILSEYTPRQLRLLFLQHDRAGTLEYSEETMKNALVLEKTLAEFVTFMEYFVRKTGGAPPKKWDTRDDTFRDRVTGHRARIDQHLRQDLNTREVLITLQRLITETYEYTAGNVHHGIIAQVDTFVTFVLDCLGVRFGGAGDAGADATTPIIDLLVEFRDVVRAECFKLPAKKGLVDKTPEELVSMVLQTKTALLQATDDLRNTKLKTIGIKLEDKGAGKPSLWKRIES